jgi:hypothetical protein
MNPNNMKQYISLLALLLCLITACKKTNYLTDGGVHNARTALSNCEYLEKHPWQSFDSLLQIIDHYKLRSEVNSATTFFAPTDFSINKFMKLRLDELRTIDENAKYTMDSLYKNITVDSIRQYLFKETITLAAAQLDPVQYTSAGGTKTAVVKQLQTDYQYTERSSTPTYLLYFIKVRGALDVPGSSAPPNEIDIRVV